MVRAQGQFKPEGRGNLTTKTIDNFVSIRGVFALLWGTNIRRIN